jgi:hypothetical protein
MGVELPHIEDKIYGLFAEFLQEDWMTDEELKETVDLALRSMGITMDKLINQLLIGVESGYTIEEQFVIIKTIFNNAKRK